MITATWRFYKESLARRGVVLGFDIIDDSGGKKS